MKHLKLYEEIYKYKPTPSAKVNDWVFALDVDFTNDLENSEGLTKYVQTHVGQVVRIKGKNTYVKYYDLPAEILEHFKVHFPALVEWVNSSGEVELNQEEITYWSENEEEMKKEAEVILTSNKFNI